MQQAILIYQGLVKPSIDRMTNKFDLANEAFVLTSVQLLICFTAWIPVEELRFKLGWFWVGIVLFQILVNLGPVVYNNLLQMIFVLVKYTKVVIYKMTKPNRKILVRNLLNEATAVKQPESGLDE